MATFAQSSLAIDSAKEGAVGNSNKESSQVGIAKAQVQSPDEKALQFFELKQYEKAADSFDAILKTAAPSRMTYYAALSNQFAGRFPRATVLFQFIVKNFPGSTEAKYSQTALTNGSLVRSSEKGVGSSQHNSTHTKPIEQPMAETNAQALSFEDRPAKASKLDNSFIQIAEKTQYSEQVRLQVLQGLALIPENVKTALFSGGTRIIIDSDSSNMGTDAGFDTAGLFVPKENAVHVAERVSTRVLKAQSEVILHEMGHAYDQSQGAVSSPAYLEAYQAECDKLNPNDTKSLSYFVTTDFGGRPAKECFAELFKVVCESGTPRAFTGGYGPTDRLLADKFKNTLVEVRKLMK